jgi:hypothetical protein
MDKIRVEVDAMQDEERGLLDDRIADINAIRERDYASVFVALIAALEMRFLAWYLFRKGTLLRVDRLTEYVRSLRNGGARPSPPAGKNDKLGELEREITLIKTSPGPPLNGAEGPRPHSAGTASADPAATRDAVR